MEKKRVYIIVKQYVPQWFVSIYNILSNKMRLSNRTLFTKRELENYNKLYLRIKGKLR